MPKVTGFFLTLSEERYSVFIHRTNSIFAESVREFAHSRNVPLVCFIINPEGQISHVGFGRRGQVSETDRRRLNVDDIFELKNPLDVSELVEQTSANVRRFLKDKLERGGLLPIKSFEAFLTVFLAKSKESAPILNKFSKERRERIASLRRETLDSLANQKEALHTAMNFADMDRSQAIGYDYAEEKPTSYLDGIETPRLREDQVLLNDFSNFFDFNSTDRTQFSSKIFRNRDSKLTVTLANRLPLEEQTGTDLIYFNENHKCFIMIQYKMMEYGEQEDSYRLPNEQLEKEIERMDDVLDHLSTIEEEESFENYRLNADPFFLKVCPRFNFEPDDSRLHKGMYLPLSYFKLLQNDRSIEGIRGGKSIKYSNVGKYFDNTAFKTIVQSGWIGTRINQSEELKKIIREVLKTGKAVILAVKEDFEAKERKNIGSLFDEPEEED
ncbi:MAG: hypothetical protein RIC95_09435 [Vicingaceae bacterium]